MSTSRVRGSLGRYRTVLQRPRRARNENAQSVLQETQPLRVQRHSAVTEASVSQLLARSQRSGERHMRQPE